MAQNDTLPGAAQRREMLARGSAQLGPAGKAFLTAGRWGEALECLTAANEKDALADLAEQAKKAGDLFYWKGALKALGQKAPEKDAEDIIAKAAEAGKPSFGQHQ